MPFLRKKGVYIEEDRPPASNTVWLASFTSDKKKKEKKLKLKKAECAKNLALRINFQGKEINKKKEHKNDYFQFSNKRVEKNVRDLNQRQTSSCKQKQEQKYRDKIIHEHGGKKSEE